MKTPNSLADVVLIKETHTRALLRLPNVVGVGVGYRQKGGKVTKELSVRVFVKRKLAPHNLPPGACVPVELSDSSGKVARTDVTVTSLIRPSDGTRYRPIVGGASFHREDSMRTATLGGFAGHASDGTIVFISNDHVMNAFDDTPRAVRFTQPSVADGGDPTTDVIGRTKAVVGLRWVPYTAGQDEDPDYVETIPYNPLDAAIGTVEVDFSPEVLEIGPAIYKITSPVLGMPVQKRGATSGLTTNGVVVALYVTQIVADADRGLAYIVYNALAVESTDDRAFQLNGDSGSILFSNNPDDRYFPGAVGLLFAANDTGTVAIANDLGAVFSLYGLESICDMLVRALLDAIPWLRTQNSTNLRRLQFADPIEAKMAQMRQFRDDLLRNYPFGKLIDDLVRDYTPAIVSAIIRDEQCFAHAARLLEPWVKFDSNHEILQQSLDVQTNRRLSLLLDRLAIVRPELELPLKTIARTFEKHAGASIAELLGNLQNKANP